MTTTTTAATPASPASDLDEGAIDDEIASEVAGGEPLNFYPDVFAFVSDFLSQLYAHEVSDQQTSWRWCSQWYAHTEALARLEALWKAFEVLRLDPGTGASVWFRDHADPCMNALTAPDGPFSRCSDTTHKSTPRLPLSPPPPGLAPTRPHHSPRCP